MQTFPQRFLEMLLPLRRLPLLHASALRLVCAGPVAPYSSAASVVLHNHPRELAEVKNQLVLPANHRTNPNFK
jgi:hypothetical protein